MKKFKIKRTTKGMSYKNYIKEEYESTVNMTLI